MKTIYYNTYSNEIAPLTVTAETELSFVGLTNYPYGRNFEILCDKAEVNKKWFATQEDADAFIQRKIEHKKTLEELEKEFAS